MSGTVPPRVLVTRSAGQGSALAEHLHALGAEPVLIPAIEFTEPTTYAPLDAALTALGSFHWVLFTSSNAVEAFVSRLTKAAHLNQLSPLRIPHIAAFQGAPSRPRIAAIGPATARALENAGLTPDLIPPQAVAESLAEALLPHSRKPDGSPTRFLLVRAEQAREHLPETLRAAGAEVTVAPAYRTVIPASSIERIRDLFAAVSPLPIAAITFTSASTVRNLSTLCEAAGVAFPASTLRISIGPITSGALRDLALPPAAEASEATVVSLAETVMRCLAQQGPQSRRRIR